MRELRTTTGQTVSISYEPATNTLIFIEDDWFADPVRASAVPPRGLVRTRVAAANSTKPSTARRPSRPTATSAPRLGRRSAELHLVG